MASNGNDPQIDQAEAAIRQVMAGKHPNQQPAVRAVGNGGAVDEQAVTYDLAKRAADTAKAMRDLADYSNHVAGDIDRIVASYISNMNRLLGKAGK